MGKDYYTRVVGSHKRNNAITLLFRVAHNQHGTTGSHCAQEYGIAKCAVFGTVSGMVSHIFWTRSASDKGSGPVGRPTVAGDHHNRRAVAPRVVQDADCLLRFLTHLVVAKPANCTALVVELAAQLRRRTDVP